MFPPGLCVDMLRRLIGAISFGESLGKFGGEYIEKTRLPVARAERTVHETPKELEQVDALGGHRGTEPLHALGCPQHQDLRIEHDSLTRTGECGGRR
jgi:hypothetical protein